MVKNLTEILDHLDREALSARQLTEKFGLTQNDIDSLEQAGQIEGDCLSNYVQLQPGHPDHKLYIPGRKFYGR